MKLIVLISSILLFVVGFIIFVIVSDFRGQGSFCRTDLMSCITECPSDKLEGASCVISCSSSNVKCLVGSLWKK